MALNYRYILLKLLYIFIPLFPYKNFLSPKLKLRLKQHIVCLWDTGLKKNLFC